MEGASRAQVLLPSDAESHVSHSLPSVHPSTFKASPLFFIQL